jgi:hypothetical protein
MKLMPKKWSGLLSRYNRSEFECQKRTNESTLKFNKID